ncbi:duf221 domain protein [Grosmannia clavigera kw1407]|uniref:Duf221 domain protein n=1 Tax=Grosmannia clavigera (strain kw1407 / UAMH 11150) TaxID=655863 RepID=F0XPD6_GROCL|nr:duf221 domain protein [Grosmannia clavigera kw1407]EFX00499.1 duf221 domain protein [Grosmannia clavigera kw1407]
MDLPTKLLHFVFARDGTNGAQELLILLQNPFAGQLKHADEQHAPPQVGKGFFAWIGPLWKTNEQDLVRLVGLDATIFMRFTAMCRNIFTVIAILGCSILIPVNYTKSVRFPNDVWLNMMGPLNVYGDPQWMNVVMIWTMNMIVAFFLWWNYRQILKLRRQYFDSPEYQMSLHSRTLMLYDIPKKFSSDEGIARIIDKVAPSSSFSRTAVARNVKILPQLIKEHEKTVRKLEEVLAKYLKDPQNLPAARPLCFPSKKDRSYATYPRGQKVDAIEYLTQRIRELELEVKDVRQSVDKRNTMSYGFASYSEISEAHAIAYAARNKKPHGTIIKLATRPNDIIWDNMPLTAATRGRRRFLNNVWIGLLTMFWIAPNAMIAIFLVSLSNLGLVWPAFQTQLETNSVFWQIVQGVASPAVTSAVYLLLPIVFRRLAIRSGNQTKTGRERHVLAKLYSFFVFNNLIIFSLFSAIWTFISAVVDKTNSGEDGWKAIVSSQPGNTFLSSLCNISPFWITWLLQRQMGVAIDLAQLWKLLWSFIKRKFSSPTPRELIELTAPPTFDYASYYNYLLYYSTVALCFGCIQPLVLPAAAIYFTVDVVLRKYMILYVFVTKTESGGQFWRVLFNRFIFAIILANLVAFLIVFVRGNANHYQSYAIAPLPFLQLIFKLYCSRTYDDKIRYYTTRNVLANPEAGLDIASKEIMRSDRLSTRFGHPVLYKPLITPMVHAKAQNILASVYSGRLTAGRDAGSGDSASVSGYSDTYVLDRMNSKQPGKTAIGGGVAMPGFEVVPESKLDFGYYKNRDEFGDDHGGGDIFGVSGDLVRPGTPGSIMTSVDSRPGTPLGGMTGQRQFSAANAMPGGPEVGTVYAPGYNKPGAPHFVASAVRTQSPAPYGSAQWSTSPSASSMRLGPALEVTRMRSPLYGAGSGGNDSSSDLMGNAAPMAVAAPVAMSYGPRSGSAQPGAPNRAASGAANSNSSDWNVERAMGSTRGPSGYTRGLQGYGNLPQEDQDADGGEPTQYDYFRGRAAQRNGGDGYNGMDSVGRRPLN